MSRPPILRPVPSPRGASPTALGAGAGTGGAMGAGTGGSTGAAGEPGPRYFGPDFAALVVLAEAVARERHGIEVPAKGRGLVRTLVEIPALLAHVLGEHQSLYARESSLATARLTGSLVRHAARLGYRLDAGVAATGLVAFAVKPGLSGSLPAGFALQSSALGEDKAQTYETLAPLELNAAWNAMRPAEGTIPTPAQTSFSLLTLPLTARHALAAGEVVLVQEGTQIGVFRVFDPCRGQELPRIILRHLGGHSFGTARPAGVEPRIRLLARPTVQTRVFGWNANPSLYPPAALASPTAYTAPALTAAEGTRARGYVADAAIQSNTLRLAEVIEPPVVSALVALVSPDAAEVLVVSAARETVANFRDGVILEVPTLVRAGTETAPLPPTLGIAKQLMETAFSAPVTTLDLSSQGTGTARAFTSYPLRAQVLTGWREVLEVAPRIANPGLMSADVLIDADLSAMRPGRPLILRCLSSGAARQASVAALLPVGTGWRVTLSAPGGLPGDWPLNDVEILGNVARISHGEARSAILGGSDGVTPHQSLGVKAAPVTRLPGALGAEIALEVRVDGVLWDLVEDFHGQGADARVVRVDTDGEGSVSLHFGGEGRGAIPPAGRRSIEAAFRVGLGRAGNVGAGRISRMRRASPLLDAVSNPLPVTGGTDPAASAGIAQQATRSVRVFDRAVSVQDHADLALLFPGVARAAARWLGSGGIELVAADAEGGGVADATALLAFLNARRDSAVPLILIAPQAVPVVLTLRVERDRAFLAETVRLAVQETLIGPGGLFTFAGRSLSAPQSLSGLYARVLAQPGVTGAQATIFALHPGSGLSDILHATDRQWLSLPPSNLDLRIVEPDLLNRSAAGGAP